MDHRLLMSSAGGLADVGSPCFLSPMLLMLSSVFFSWWFAVSVVRDVFFFYQGVSAVDPKDHKDGANYHIHQRASWGVCTELPFEGFVHFLALCEKKACLPPGKGMNGDVLGVASLVFVGGKQSGMDNECCFSHIFSFERPLSPCFLSSCVSQRSACTQHDNVLMELRHPFSGKSRFFWPREICSARLLSRGGNFVNRLRSRHPWCDIS